MSIFKIGKFILVFVTVLFMVYVSYNIYIFYRIKNECSKKMEILSKQEEVSPFMFFHKDEKYKDIDRLKDDLSNIPGMKDVSIKTTKQIIEGLVEVNPDNRAYLEKYNNLNEAEENPFPPEITIRFNVADKERVKSEIDKMLGEGMANTYKGFDIDSSISNMKSGYGFPETVNNMSLFDYIFIRNKELFQTICKLPI